MILEFPKFSFYLLLLLLLSLIFVSRHHVSARSSTHDDGEGYRTYIIHVEKKPDGVNSDREWHESFLPSTPMDLDGEDRKERLVYSFGHTFSGFVARLTEEELESMRGRSGFLHAHPDKIRKTHTTHTPEFLGLQRHDDRGLWANSGFGKGVIIGVLDSGITPGHPSFDDAGMSPPPSKWKGRCEFFQPGQCNNKIIGARSFIQGKNKEQPIDIDGHGTHVAGIAAGRFVENASFLDNARGTASGMAPEAHIAVYRVCYDSGFCYISDMIAGIESAVKDGVDIISMSLGVGGSISIYDDPISTASLSAVKRGVFFSCSAGNSGPYSATVDNVAPWLFTVGASTMNRRIRAVVKLDYNGLEFEGESGYQPTNFTSSFLPLVYPQSDNEWFASECTNVTSLKEIGVAGKVVLCKGAGKDKGNIVKEAGGVAIIFLSRTTDTGFDTFSDVNVIPASQLNIRDSRIIYSYVISRQDSNPISASISFMGTDIEEGRSSSTNTNPAVASFSSRGPSTVTPYLLKPDIIGPGVNVLAAWHKPIEESPPFAILSGTSMSCPHLSGIAALLKSVHPDWSPSMIKSALMTTTDVTYDDGTPLVDNWDLGKASFDVMGAGHVNPLRSENPGLVYEIQHQDYISYMCAIGYTDKQVTLINSTPTNCSKFRNVDDALRLNYPSISVVVSASDGFKKKVKRTVTNVGRSNSTYIVKINSPPTLTIVVHPKLLEFTGVGQKKSFSVSIAIDKTKLVSKKTSSLPRESFLTWVSSDDNRITVRIPISAVLGA
ncbi:Subtilisin-like serine protease [Zostera marina]|uniref:Subtilisin-like serine protease n=1 Tax=Zostera marina TaxID=29655 RepID=A0A0K9P8I4_ZOSMR|nr:Subtilisin-like serine protease [Zostera marina]